MHCLLMPLLSYRLHDMDKLQYLRMLGGLRKSSPKTLITFILFTKSPEDLTLEELRLDAAVWYQVDVPIKFFYGKLFLATSEVA